MPQSGPHADASSLLATSCRQALRRLGIHPNAHWPPRGFRSYPRCSTNIWGYVSDAVRLDRYRAAIAKVIAKDSSVADLGSGSGVLGLLCLQAGAGRLVAVDDSDMLEVAREALTRSGYSDCSAFIRGKSSQIELPERVDVVICDHVGYFGFDYGVVEFFADARKRFLKPGGNLIPSSIRLNVAAVGAQRCDELVNGWRAEGIPHEISLAARACGQHQSCGQSGVRFLECRTALALAASARRG